MNQLWKQRRYKAKQQLIIKNKNYVNKYKLNKGCQNNSCNWKGKFKPEMLDFDHIDPKLKTKCIQQMVQSGYSLNKIIEEINKCQILCSNCHRTKTKKYIYEKKEI